MDFMKCPNCKNETTEEFCGKCGQKKFDDSRTLLTIFLDLFNEQFGLGGKFWRTMKPFVVKPGYISKIYIAGKRKSYISPVQMLVTLNLLFIFFVQNFHISTTNMNISVDSENRLNYESRIIFDTNDHCVARLEEQMDLLKKHEEEKDQKSFLEPEFDAEKHKRKMEARENVFSLLKNSCHFSEVSTEIQIYLIWLQAPFMALLLALFFKRSKIPLIHHFFHSFHILSFQVMILNLFVLAYIMFNINVNPAFYWVVTYGSFFLYIIVSVKNVYQEKFFKSFIKSCLVFVIYSFVWLMISTIILLFFIDKNMLNFIMTSFIDNQSR